MKTHLRAPIFLLIASALLAPSSAFAQQRAEQKAEQKAGQKAKVKGAPHRFYVPETPAGGATTTFSCAAGYKLCPSHPVCCLEARTCAAGGSPCGGGYGPCCY
jgi:hypothetical protein